MTDLYLESIGLINPTIVKRDNNGKVERLESVGLDMVSLVAFWRKCFDLEGLLFEKITLHCKSKDFNAIGRRPIPQCLSVRELLAEQGVECVIDDEWFKDHEVKNAVKEFAEKLKAIISEKGTLVRDYTGDKLVLRREVDVDEVLESIDKLFEEVFGNDEE